MAPLPWFAVAGAGVGLLFGLFGVGGSSVATPVLALLGVRGVVAVASPLPSTVPAALAGAWAYLRDGDVDASVARWSVMGGVPGTVIGALASRLVGGNGLLVASGVVLGIVGVRVLRPVTAEARRARAGLRRPAVVIGAAGAIGVFTGLLANGGGFLLVPLYLVVLGLGMRTSAGTSLVVIAALSIPTLATHWALGHIDWAVAATFAAGAVPGAALGSRVAHRVRADTLRTAFGWLAIAFAAWFVVHQVTRG